MIRQYNNIINFYARNIIFFIYKFMDDKKKIQNNQSFKTKLI